MVETLHPVTIKIPESTYQAAKELADRRGYFSVEELLSEWLEVETASVPMPSMFETASVPMTPKLAAALEEGLEDSRNGNVVSLDELNRLLDERRAAWIREHGA